MHLFKRKRKQGPGNSLYGYFNNGLKKQQLRAAVYLNQKTAHVRPKTLAVWLVIFCLAFGTASACVILNAFNSKSHHAVSVSYQKLPRYIGKPNLSLKPLPVTRGKEYLNIEKCKRYMDSLARSPSAKKVYDSIILSRPGLMDSLTMIEKYF